MTLISIQDLLSINGGKKIAPELRGVLETKIKNGRLVGDTIESDGDVQIHFKLKKYISETSALAQVDIKFRCYNQEINPRLYIDYGTGFHHEISISMSKFKDLWSAFVPMPHLVKFLRLDPFEGAGVITITTLVARRASALQLADLVLRKGPNVSAAIASRRATEGINHLITAMDRFGHSEVDDQIAISVCTAIALNIPVSEEISSDTVYIDWISTHEEIDKDDIAWMKKESTIWPNQPLLSVLMPVYDPPIMLLEEAIASLQAQTYDNWELCLADDASTNPAVRICIERLAAKDPRIRPVFREVNGHISEATNSAAAIASGEWLVLMDNDDLLPPHALWTVAHYAQANPNAVMMFSDEDKLTPGGTRAEPYAKGTFDRFLLYGHNMFSHLGIYRRALFERVGGFRKGYEGSQDYDLTLRCLDVAGEPSVVHIPHVLYHWRQIPGSTSMGASQKNYAFEAAKRAINDHFVRNNWPLLSIDSDVPGVAAVCTLSTPSPKTISVIIPTRDGFEHLSRCIASMRRHADPLVEVVIVDNGSVDSATLDFIATLSREPHRYRVVRDDNPFNFSRLVNVGVANARGDIICLLNDDTEFLDPGAFERVRAWLSILDVGVVGARLLYPDGSVQHFGVHIGVGEHRVAEHAYLGMPDGQHANFSKSRLLQQFSAVTAACMFLRIEDYQSLGGCDETFPVAYNDVDLCLRVRARGLKIICDPAIRLIHHESRSRGQDDSPAKRERLEADAERIRSKWGEEGLRDPFYSPKFNRTQSGYKLSQNPPRAPWKVPLRLGRGVENSNYFGRLKKRSGFSQFRVPWQ